MSYNQKYGPTFLCLPLDYSSFDHTITMDCIEESIEQVINVNPRFSKLLRTWKDFRNKMALETFQLKINGKKYENKYSYGMMSGWRITSSAESLLNAITTFGVFRELGYDPWEILTMGDDLIVVLRLPNLTRSEQKQLLEAVADRYNQLGFKMNASKNSISYNFMEYLRTTIYSSTIRGYPMRAVQAITVEKPERKTEAYGYTDLYNSIEKLCNRAGCLSRIGEFLKLICDLNINKNIQELGYK